jgi:hypothetical protein
MVIEMNARFAVVKMPWNIIKKNIDEYKIRNKKWRESNPDKLKKNQETFFENNPNYQKTWYQENKENVNNRNKKRREVDTNYRLSENIRHLISNSLKFNNFQKKSKTNDILGCTTEEFKNHLELNFESWMSWENYGNPKDGVIEPYNTTFFS